MKDNRVTEAQTNVSTTQNQRQIGEKIDKNIPQHLLQFEHFENCIIHA